MEDKSFKNLIAYKKAFELAMEIFEVTKLFPKEERYSLTDQIRRSSRSVTVCLAEAHRKRRYVAHFVSKISDADMENSETLVWLEFAESCHYISSEVRISLEAKAGEIGKILNYMMEHPAPFGSGRVK